MDKGGVKKINILGVYVSAVNYDTTLSKITEWISSGKKKYICVAATHLIMECQKNSELLNKVNKAGLVMPDGMPLVWLLKLHGQKESERVYGPTLMLKICSLAESKGWKIFLLGGASGQVKILKENLTKKFPGLRIVGTFDTPERKVDKKINQLINAQVVFVGLGCPYQELWMADNLNKVKTNVLIGVGAAFNFISGHERQAPKIIQDVGLEWFFRLTQNPQRLWHRYTFQNLQFIWKILTSKIINRSNN